MNRYRIIDEMIQKGYALVLENDCPAGCDKWLEAWGLIKELFAEGLADDIFDLDKKYSWGQYPSNFVQDADDELHNAGVDDVVYHRKRIVFCEELCQWGGSDGLFMGNARISIAEAHVELGDIAAAEHLYEGWLRDDPEWGWGYIGWSDYYFESKQYKKAEGLLLTGYLREGLRDKVDVVDRLITLYNYLGKPEKAKEFKKIQMEMIPAEPFMENGQKPAPVAAGYQKTEPVRVVKIGRNEPCPCGSGKKYKKCCLS